MRKSCRQNGNCMCCCDAITATNGFVRTMLSNVVSVAIVITVVATVRNNNGYVATAFTSTRAVIAPSAAAKSTSVPFRTVFSSTLVQQQTKTELHSSTFDNVNEIVSNTFKGMSSSADALKSSSSLLLNGVWDEVKHELLQGISTTSTLPSAGVSMQEIFQKLLTTGFSSEITLQIGIVVALIVGKLTLDSIMVDDDMATTLNDDVPYSPGATTYSPELAAEFYKQRRGIVVRRVLKLAILTSNFTAGILFDWLILGKLFKDEEYTVLKRNEPARATQALVLSQRLGPTFLKLAQALSIRTDLIPEAYALELRQLQDNVQPFDDDIAKTILQQQLLADTTSDDLSSIFPELSSTTIASASIGQVYKGLYKDPESGNTTTVAVKIQRPGILNEIALDLYILRTLTPIQTVLQNKINGVQTSQVDIDSAVSLVDEWGRGFVAETDYYYEAQNTKEFVNAMSVRGLDNAICAPNVINVTDTVLITEWVDGTRLDLTTDSNPDTARLCAVGINAYLTMLLDTGVLHCDPHPGNLLRTTDGKLCILDWGMTLTVPTNLQYALLELIAHINSENFDAVPQDFVNLGFATPGTTAEKLQESGITEGLTFAFQQLSKGGGPKQIQQRVKKEFQQRYGSDLTDRELQSAAREEMINRMEQQLASEGVDVKGVTNIMETMSQRNRELFALPPYVLYVARAFSTLEGIGLRIDENYSIIQECYPYLAKRLFTDRSPRAKAALQTMLGLPTTPNTVDNEVASNRIDDPSSLATVQSATASSLLSSIDNDDAQKSTPTSKILEMTDGFTTFTAATKDVDVDGAGQDAAVREFVRLFLDPKGSTIQDILVDETARVTDAGVRAFLRAAFVDSAVAKSVATTLTAPKSAFDSSDLRNTIPEPIVAALIDNPAKIPEFVQQLVASNKEDDQILSSAAELSDAIRSRVSSTTDSSNNNKETTTPRGNGVRKAIAERLSDGASMIPSVPTPGSNILSPLSSIVTNPTNRQVALESLPGVSNLGRRVAAGLLRRAAFRTEQSSSLPETARTSISNANTALANAIDVVDDDNEK